ncbi:hypothetical protein P175DRAFT_0553460 [Aspergillus ochraceoroseus IBT 24754]|uniref:Uncharacterized protein n=2 Tax=Aspergillus subgen. Nidulantes TaxID=2720870 RepID=A0A0F8X002_9EURO|nr:uncharacterized protein P175DRAFT_0553460 [Aspergillus ochraceoroseus IBT 24754]KKK16907.1 hypothetical protein ARAM_002670 [Aspergillus rambellii]PTU24176.1 hypothetical protein P175DRAFT_0553460 [Aspergillus ochraceoroseus IBT 24754]
MTQLSNAAIIVIVIVACLAAVSLGAALSRQYSPHDDLQRSGYSREQELYMRSVRMKNMGIFRRESGPPMMTKDLESASTAGDSSRY